MNMEVFWKIILEISTWKTGKEVDGWHWKGGWVSLCSVADCDISSVESWGSSTIEFLIVIYSATGRRYAGFQKTDSCWTNCESE